MLSKLQISKPSLYFCGFLLVIQLINGFHDVCTSLSEISSYWFALAFYWAFFWWFLADSRNHGHGWVDGYLDVGLLLYIGWIFIVPYYLYKTRGWKALYTIGLFLSVTIGAYIVGAIISLLINLL